MASIIIKIIDTKLENDLVLFQINDNNKFCISKSYSNSLKKFIENVFGISMMAIKNESGLLYDITNIDTFPEDPIDYDSMDNSVYVIEYIEEQPKSINYEIIL